MRRLACRILNIVMFSICLENVQAQDVSIDINLNVNVAPDAPEPAVNQNDDVSLNINVPGVTVIGDEDSVTTDSELFVDLDIAGVTVIGEEQAVTDEASTSDRASEGSAFTTDIVTTPFSPTTEELTVSFETTFQPSVSTEDVTLELTKDVSTEESTQSDNKTTPQPSFDLTTSENISAAEPTTRSDEKEATSAELTTPEVASTSTPDPGLQPRPTVSNEECDRETHSGCNVTNLERCTIIRERSPRCRCISGYTRARDGYTCVAVTTFMLSLNTAEPFSTFLYDPLSDRYRMLEYDVRNALFDVMATSLLGAVTMDVIITGFREFRDGTIIIDFKVEISQSFLPSEELVRLAVKDSLRENLVTDSRGRGQVLKGTSVLITPANVDDLFVMEPDPCLDALLNYCSRDAVCLMVGGVFACECNGGYLDQSLNPDVIAGEICTPDLGDCECLNGGRCEFDTEEKDVVCRCATWYIGPSCEIDGRIVLIACGIVAFAMLFVCVACCGRYYMRKRQRNAFATRCGVVASQGYRPYFGQSWFTQRRFYTDPSKTQLVPPPSLQPDFSSYWLSPVRAVFSPRPRERFEEWSWAPY